MFNELIERLRGLGRRDAASRLRCSGQFGFNVLNANGIDITGDLTRAAIDADGYAWAKNRVVDQGINYILNAALRGEGTISTYYIAPFAANVTPAANLTAATFASTTTEFTNYTESTRQEWVTDGAATALSLVNNAAPAVFTVDDGVQTTIYGGGLLSNSGKSSTAGALVAAGRLANGLTGLQEGFEVRLRYRITGSSS